MTGSPRYSVGRPMKAGRDDIVGLLCALEHYLDSGEAEQYAHNERWCEFFMERLAGMRGLSPRVRRPNALGQDLPEVVVEIDEDALGKSRDEVARALWECEVRVQVGLSGESESSSPPIPSPIKTRNTSGRGFWRSFREGRKSVGAVRERPLQFSPRWFLHRHYEQRKITPP